MKQLFSWSPGETFVYTLLKSVSNLTECFMVPVEEVADNIQKTKYILIPVRPQNLSKLHIHLLVSDGNDVSISNF